MLETIRAVKSKYCKKGIYENIGNVRETWKVINSMLGRNTTTTLISEFSLFFFFLSNISWQKEWKPLKLINISVYWDKLAENIPVLWWGINKLWSSTEINFRSFTVLSLRQQPSQLPAWFYPGYVADDMYISITGWSTSAIKPKQKSEVEAMNSRQLRKMLFDTWI